MPGRFFFEEKIIELVSKTANQTNTSKSEEKVAEKLYRS